MTFVRDPGPPLAGSAQQTPAHSQGNNTAASFEIMGVDMVPVTERVAPYLMYLHVAIAILRMFAFVVGQVPMIMVEKESSQSAGAERDAAVTHVTDSRSGTGRRGASEPVCAD